VKKSQAVTIILMNNVSYRVEIKLRYNVFAASVPYPLLHA